MEITIPYNFTPRTYQLDFLKNRARFKIGVWHRRSGKTKTALNQQIIRSQLKKGIYYYILPTYRQSKQVLWDGLVKTHIPNEITLRKNDSELAVYYKNGSIQRFVGCEDVDKHRGVDAIDVVFDEYSEEAEEIWTAIFQPILRENGGSATFIFTPKGKNHSWELLQKAQGNPEWFTSVLGVKDTQVFTEPELEEIKKNTPQVLYQQEYEVSFVDNAGQYFRRIRENLYEPKDLTHDGDFQIGTDLAKYQDWTVITPFNLNTFKVYPQDRFNQVDWNLQKARLQVANLKFKGNITNCIDATGVGDPIVEDLRREGMEIPTIPFDHAFKFTQKSREDLLKHLAILLEQDKIKLPNDEGLIRELESMRYELSDGSIKIKVPEGMTDDRIMSVALSVYGQNEPQEYYSSNQEIITEVAPMYRDINM
jgi:hypothetical protein